MFHSKTKQPNNATVIDTCTQRLFAMKTHVHGNPSIAIEGTPGTATDLVAIYQRSLDARAALAAKRSEVLAALTERDDAEAARRQADRALKPWVVHQFGPTSTQAYDFGFPPARVGVMTPDQAALAVLKREATRKARHTMGRKQRLLVRGSIPEEEPTL